MMNFSLAAAVLLLGAKVTAAVVTGSSAIYSDAAESVVHFLAVCFAVWALRLAHKPADETHHFGHDKVSFLSAGFEGAMISAAALLIFYEAVRQMIFGVRIENLGFGVAVTAAAAGINLVLGLSLVALGKRSGSPLLRANGMHVLTDVWSSVAVLVALGLYKSTGWVWWDPIAAMLAALNILRVGYKLIRESLGGLLDESDPVMESAPVICWMARSQNAGFPTTTCATATREEPTGSSSTWFSMTISRWARRMKRRRKSRPALRSCCIPTGG